jgi:hypothetical protein
MQGKSWLRLTQPNLSLTWKECIKNPRKLPLAHQKVHAWDCVAVKRQSQPNAHSKK